MRLNRRGEGGFAESMIALMAVIVSLTLFMAVLPMAFESPEEKENVPLNFLNGLSVADGTLTSETDLHKMREDLGYSAMRLNVKIPGNSNVFSFSSGYPVSDDIITSSGSFLLPIEERKMIASYELAVWR